MYRTSSADLTARIEDAARRQAELEALDRRLRQLAYELSSLDSRIEAEAAVVAKEALDVERLEGGGLRAFLMTGFGDRAARLSAERAEAEAARARHDALCASRDQRNGELVAAQQRVLACAGADDDFAAAMAAKEKFLLQAGGGSATALLTLSDELGRCLALDAQQREALDAGQNAEIALAALASEVDRAVAIGARNLEGGHGHHLHRGHHHHHDDHSWWDDRRAREALDTSRDLAGQAEAWLATFQRELADVGGQLADRGEVIGHLLASAAPERDFLSSLFHHEGDDFTLVMRAERAGQEIAVRRGNVAAQLSRLNEERSALTATIAQLQAQRAELVQRAE